MLTWRLILFVVFVLGTTFSSAFEQAADFRSQYVGCYRDNGAVDGRSMGPMFIDKNQMSLNMCRERCKQLQKTFFAVQYSEQCYCDDQYNKYGTAKNCEMTCSGNPRQICGGDLALSVYRVCPSGYYDRDCSKACNYCHDNPSLAARCFHNGTCTDGYARPSETTDSETDAAIRSVDCRRAVELLIVMSVLAGVFLLLLGVAVFCLWKMWLRLKRHQSKPQLQLQQQRPRSRAQRPRSRQPLPTTSTSRSVQYRSTSSYYEELDDPVHRDRANPKPNSKSNPAALTSSMSATEAVYKPPDEYQRHTIECVSESTSGAPTITINDGLGTYDPSDPADQYMRLYNASDKYLCLTTEYADKVVEDDKHVSQV